MHRAAIATITTTTLAASLAMGCRPHHASSSSPDASPLGSIDAAPASPETVIAFDIAKLAAFGLDLLRVQNTLVASGIPVTPDQPGTFIVTAPRDIDAIAETILGIVNGAPIRVRDVAQIQRRMPRRD